MIPELGQLCLTLALLMSIAQAAVPLLHRACAPHPLLHLVKPTATATFLLITAAFAALVHAYAVSDFSVLNVVLNSHSTKPMLYKIVGSWGNHEGSMLLWMWVLAACGFLVALLPARDVQLKAVTLAVLGLISAGFLAFILFTSNPFLRIFPIPADGEDLNPLLQDIGLAFHPPTLYVGYVGFGVVFAYAIAGLLLKRVDSHWARTVHPWILLPWAFLTLGIGAGSWWAYRELGWGGWWFWDPVENVSLLPWLVGTALIHSNMVLERRGQLARWVVLLAILAFTLSLVGTFIVRSGLITSVHAFASDPARGMFILAYIVVVSGAALLVYSFSNIQPSKPIALISRSGFILINNLLLVAAAAIVFVAILYPLALELVGLPSISVGAPYFNATFLPMTAALPILAALAPLMAWDRTTPKQLRSLCVALAPALAVAALIGLALFTPTGTLLAIGVGMTVWMVLGTWRYIVRLRAARMTWLSAVGLRHVASAVAHLGLAIFILGMTLTATLKQTYEAPLNAKAPMVMGDYSLRLIAAERRTQDNFITRRATLEISRHGRVITTLTPELRYYPVRGMQTTEAALLSTPVRDIYIVLGESNYSEKKEDAALGVRLYVTPAQQAIWFGFVLAAAGGFLALLTALRRTKGE
jgi:cytochrome c-type biogenesis protein CcmF